MNRKHSDPPDLPNVVLIVFDDTGWADFGCFGSEIDTPTIDRLAADGLRFTNFHVTPLCSPTRACLLTGRNHHRVGMGWLADRDFGVPGRRGRVTQQAAMLPAVLKSGGYATFLSGKWHLAPAAETTPAGPFDQWPLARGFERFYGFLSGATDQYAPEMVLGNDPIETPTGDGYHLSGDLVDRSMQFLADHLAFGGDRPFFLQLAFSATHTPHQAPPDYVDKYVPVFEKGWDRTRQDRLARQKQLGLLPDTAELVPPNEGVRPWEELSVDEQRVAVRLQAAYAGFLEYTDVQLGRLMSFLGSAQLLDDTIIVCISDNGASGGGGDLGAINGLTRWNQAAGSLEDELARLDLVGGPRGPGSYPEGWAMAGNTPFRRYKEYVDAGGIRSPMIVHWPAGIGRGNQLRHQFVHAIDIMPTILDIAGIDPPETFEGVDQLPMDGISAAATLVDSSAASPRRTQYFEIEGLRAIQHGDFRAVAQHARGDDYADDKWRLYDTTVDPSEVRDLSAQHPDRVREMEELWWQEAESNQVLPLDDRRMSEILTYQTPDTELTRDRYLLRPQQSRFSVYGGLCGTNRSLRFTTTLTGAARDGIIVASGGGPGGYVLYVADDRLVFEHHHGDESVMVEASRRLPAGPTTVVAELRRDSDGPGASVRLSVDDQEVGTGHIPTAGARLSYRGMEIGRDTTPHVSDAYRDRGDFAMPDSVLDHVVLEFLEPARTIEAALMEEQSQ